MNDKNDFTFLRVFLLPKFRHLFLNVYVIFSKSDGSDVYLKRFNNLN